MYRLSEELAKQIIFRIKPPDYELDGITAFLPKNTNSVGLIDPICCIGSTFDYVLESPKPLIYPTLPFNKCGIDSYFLYKREELKLLNEPWEINRMFVDPVTKDPEEKIDVQEAAIVLPSDIEKLTIPVTYHLNTIEELIKKEPAIIDCLDMEKKYE